MSSIFGQIRPQTTELAALERLKIPHGLKMGENDVKFFSVVFLLEIIQNILNASLALVIGDFVANVSLFSERISQYTRRGIRIRFAS